MYVLTAGSILLTKILLMKTTILIALCCISLSLTAQDKNKNNWKEKMKKNMPMMTKSVGVSFVEFDRLNSRMAEFPQYKTAPDHIFTISMGSMHVMNNFITQTTLTAGSSLTGDREERSTALRILGVGFDLGYDVIPADRVMLYPMVGVGAETYHAIFNKDVNAVDFDDVAASPAVQNSIRTLKFTQTNIMYRLGLGLAFKSPKHNGTIGLQGGYAGGFRNRGWKSAEYQKLEGAPVDDIRRFSVSLVLTGGMMMHK
jgi:hypothetical protein